MMGADLLVLLSDIDGLYTRAAGDRTRTRASCRSVERITPEIEAMAGSAGSELSRGGMQTKIEAGKIADRRGHDDGDRPAATSSIRSAAIADGRALHLVPRPTPTR